MAFLDNSGDIILDAVLTEVGRRRMANGNFSVSKFALSDDEINYGLYQINHPSGSAYADLEILQTPILEATTELNLFTGLLSLTNLSILYMPDLLLNEKLSYSVKMKNNTVYVSVNSETQAAINTGFGTGYNTLAGQSGGGSVIVVESGINNADIAMTSANQSSYIVSTNMLDSSLSVTYNNNYVSYPMGSSTTATFATNSDGSWAGSDPTLTSITTISAADRDGFSTATATMVQASVFTQEGATTDATSFVNCAGVVGSMAGINVAVDSALTTTTGQTADARWSKFGSTGQTITGLAGTYSTIATSLELMANNSSAALTIPITLIKQDTTA
tara:strand:+ start:3558 stop:4553 length:996 start_codon:yes stop_codon:yes gene_type:complete